MSIVPSDFFSGNSGRSLSDLWDHFLAHHDAFFSNPPFSSFPFPFRSPSLFSSFRTVPYSELSMESEGSIAARIECREIEEALVFVADLPSGVDKDGVKVEAEEGGGALKISGGGGGGRFSWKFRLPASAEVHLLSSSVENGVLTVVVPKVKVWDMRMVPPRNVRVVEIEGSD